MKKNLFWLVVVIALFVISCSSDEESLPCITVADCPDSSFVCLDGECVVATADDGDIDNDGGNGGGGTGTSDGNDSNGGGDSSSDDDNGGDNGLPDPTPSDDDADSTADDDSDADTSDSGSDDDTDTDTSDSGSDNDADTDTSDSESDDDTDTDTSDSGSDDDTDTDTSDTGDSGSNVEDPVDPAACAAAIAQLPHGGKYDWDDGTTQGFLTNTYWDLVEFSVLPARSGNYSFGKYSGYSVDKDQLSPLSTATDLSQCAQCTVKASFYVKGQICNGNCEAQTFLHPTCNGEGNVTVIDKTSAPWSQWTIPPESPWVDDDLDFFKAKANSNQYSAVAWKDLEWTIPAACMTEQFVFGFRFRSDSPVAGPGLVVDDLTIYATTKNEPKGEFESAENGKITGWACDPDAYSEKVPVIVRYHKNKNESVVSAERKVYAEIERTDLTQCGGTFYHGFEVPLDAELAGILGEGIHSATVFAGDIPADCSGAYKEIGKTDLTVPANYDPKK